MAAIDHEGIAPVHMVDEFRGVPYFVMPLLEGESLQTRLERGPLPVGTVARITRQLASALAAAHASGVVHRDVKPSNIWMKRRANHRKTAPAPHRRDLEAPRLCARPASPASPFQTRSRNMPGSRTHDPNKASGLARGYRPQPAFPAPFRSGTRWGAHGATVYSSNKWSRNRGGNFIKTTTFQFKARQ